MTTSCEKAEQLARAIAAPLHQRLVQRDARIAELERRLAAVEARGPSVEYAGTFTAGKCYSGGQLCTRNGGLWLCSQKTSARPGSDPAGWRLVCKEGRAQ